MHLVPATPRVNLVQPKKLRHFARGERLTASVIAAIRCSMRLACGAGTAVMQRQSVHAFNASPSVDQDAFRAS